MTSAAYTPLESLLLFQALRVDGVQSVNFSQISDDLQRIPLVTGDRSYDAARLSPDALKELYLRLLKDEVRRDLDTQLARDGDDTAINGDASPGSRKRKAPSPSLPTVHEAAQHSHLIPQLVTRLYARYRENVVRHIREQEERYDVAVRESEEIKAGEWDDRLQKQHAASATSSPKTVSAASPGQAAVIRRDHVQTPTSVNASPTSPRPPLDVNPPPKRYSQAKIDAVINHGPEPPSNQGNHRRTSSNTTLPPLSEMAPQSPRFGIPPRMPSSHGVHNSPHTVHAAPYSPHHAHPGSATGSPHLQQNISRPSSSPRPILPPPPGMKLNQPPPHLPGSPNMHGPPPNVPPQQHYQQSPQQYAAQHPLSTGGAPPQQRPYPQPHGAPHMPTSGYYSPQQPPYQDRRTLYATPQAPPPHTYQHPQQAQHPPHHHQQQQHQPPHHPPHAGGYMLPPFQGTTQDPTKTPHHQNVAQQHAQRGQHTPQYAARPLAYNQNVPSGPATAPRLQPPPQPHQRLMSDIVAALATPPRPIARPLWKSERKPRPAQTPGSPKRPAIEPMSPPKPQRPSPVRQPPPTSMPEPAEPASAQTRRGGRKSVRQVRETSVASSTVDGSLRATRSQSVSSVAVSEGRPASRRLVKNEPSTPADHAGDTDETERTVPKRTRRGTLTQAPASSKRKRQTPEVDDEPEPRKNTITATRNFQKMSSTIMNDIVSNKHGSRFANPVNEKQAEGYRDIIFRPQDLKTIRGMISHGTKAIANATTADSPSATSSRAAESTVELERSVDLMPPKAIVNGAQLEKEVMRMLANAVMFNPGEDGMVMDTREMFEDVEAKMAEWRGAEREEGGAEEGEDAEGKGKRRKV